MPEEKTGNDALRIYHSGAASDGAAQSDPDACLGGYRAGDEVEMLGVLVTDPISGITIERVSGENGAGDGTLSAESTGSLAWTPPGGTKGAAVAIANGETKLLEAGGGEPEKWVRVSRTSADDLSGSATLALAETYNNAVGGDNVGSAEAVTGIDDYKAVILKAEAVSEVTSIKAVVRTLGSSAVSSVGQLGASGAGSIEAGAGAFSDWPERGGVRIETAAGVLREICEYAKVSDTELAVAAAGRELLGTTAAAGASDDVLYPVPLIRIAKEAPSAQPDGYIQTIADENTAPAAVTWSTAIDAADGIDIGDLTAGYIQGLWIHREIPSGMVATSGLVNDLALTFDAA